MQKRVLQIQRRIEKIKQQLLNIGEMRPGSLTKQYQKPKEKKGGLYQISYTYKMRSKTEYVRPEFVSQLRKQITTFKTFKKLIQEWTDLAIEYSKLKIDIEKNKM